MNEVSQLIYNEQAKDRYREAENERLARLVQNQNEGILDNVRKALGRGLLAVGQNLLKENQR
jgi:hypothetical protein